LTATQQRRLRLYAHGKTLREIAAIEEASFQSVSESIEAGRKKFLKIFRQTP
jgi:DNA-binding CsgD family transcriptional regulator